MAGSVPVRARLVAVTATSPRDGSSAPHAVSVRDAVRADAGAIAAVRVAGWRAGYVGMIADDVLAALDPAADRARWLADWDDGPRRRVAEVDGAVVGFTTTGAYRVTDDHPSWPRGPDDGEVMAVYVDPGTWSRGVGGALLTDAIAVLTDAGHPVARLWVLAGNVRARRFYARHGFLDEEPLGVVAPFTPRGGGPPAPEVRFSRPLTR